MGVTSPRPRPSKIPSCAGSFEQGQQFMLVQRIVAVFDESFDIGSHCLPGDRGNASRFPHGVTAVPGRRLAD